MFNKINNNVSFKGVYIFPNINNLKEKNREKAGCFAKIAGQVFPSNDIFLGADEKGELYMRVQKSNPLHLLLDNEIAQKMDMNPIQLAALINLVTAYKYAHDKLWGIPEAYILDKTNNIDDMDIMDVSYQFCRSIDLFNKTHKEIES